MSIYVIITINTINNLVKTGIFGIVDNFPVILLTVDDINSEISEAIYIGLI